MKFFISIKGGKLPKIIMRAKTTDKGYQDGLKDRGCLMAQR